MIKKEDSHLDEKGKEDKLKMNIQKQGEQLLLHHEKFKTALLKIPLNREINYQEDLKESKRIGRPRFNPPLYQWDQGLLKELRNHLQNIWIFFENHSYWFDETIFPLIAFQERRDSKRSIIFLLTNDVWNTDEVYGDYLIEKLNNAYSVSYYRREKKIRTFSLKVKNKEELREWICTDARQQISNQFIYLWESLETEISMCMNEKYIRLPSTLPSTNSIKKQLINCEKVMAISAESAMMSLGRLAEHWLLIKLGKLNKQPFDRLIRQAENEEILKEKEQYRLFRSIQKSYNAVKHQLGFQISNNRVLQMLEQFSIFLGK